MNEQERLSFEGWAQLPAFKRKIERAKQIVEEAIAIAPSAVAISWGTDSINLLHLAQQVYPSIPAFNIGDELEDLQNNYSEVAAAYCQRFSPNYQRILYDEATEGGFYDVVARLAFSYPMTLIGVRKQESKYRNIAISKYGVIHQYQSGAKKGAWRAFPLASWTWEDKWAYTVSHDLPYLKSYDATISGSRETSRTAVIHNFDFHRGSHQAAILRHGGIAQIRAIAPEYFALYCQFYPEIRSLS